jgi:hypothetical protein
VISESQLFIFAGGVVNISGSSIKPLGVVPYKIFTGILSYFRYVDSIYTLACV